MKKTEQFLTSCFAVELLSFNGGETELVSSCLNAGDTDVDSNFEVLTNTLVIFICLSFTEAALFLCSSLLSWLFKAVEPILLVECLFANSICSFRFVIFHYLDLLRKTWIQSFTGPVRIKIC